MWWFEDGQIGQHMFKDFQKGISAAVNAVATELDLVRGSTVSPDGSLSAASLSATPIHDPSDAYYTEAIRKKYKLDANIHEDAFRKVPGWKFVCETNQILLPVRSQNKSLLAKHNDLEQSLDSASNSLQRECQAIDEFTKEIESLEELGKIVSSLRITLTDTISQMKLIEESIELALEKTFQQMKQQTKTKYEQMLYLREEVLRQEMHRLSGTSLDDQVSASLSSMLRKEDLTLENISVRPDKEDAVALEEFLNS